MWLAFLGTVVLMQLPPGPDSMLVMARGIGQGRRIALFTVLGMTLGAGMIQLPLLALGVSSLVRASPLAFKLLQWTGAGYLIWLGLRLVVSSEVDSGPSRPEAAGRLAAAREGMIANLANPWPITFMVAFLPPVRGSGSRLRHFANAAPWSDSEDDGCTRAGHLCDRVWSDRKLDHAPPFIPALAATPLRSFHHRSGNSYGDDRGYEPVN